MKPNNYKGQRRKGDTAARGIIRNRHPRQLLRQPVNKQLTTCPRPGSHLTKNYEQHSRKKFQKNFKKVPKNTVLPSLEQLVNIKVHPDDGHTDSNLVSTTRTSA
jgi:hypothetical protein